LIYFKKIKLRVGASGLRASSENPGRTFPVKERISTELIIDRRAELTYKNGTRTFWLNRRG